MNKAVHNLLFGDKPEIKGNLDISINECSFRIANQPGFFGSNRGNSKNPEYISSADNFFSLFAGFFPD